MIRRLMLTSLAAATISYSAMAQTSATTTTSSESTRRLDYLTGYLALTDAQKAAAKAIFDAADAAVTTADGSRAAAQTALKTAIKADAADAELDRLSAAIGTIEGQVTAIRAKAEAKFYALLTAEQKAKYDALTTPGAGGGGGGRGPHNFDLGFSN